MAYLEIEKVTGREIIDSRGNPTVEAEVRLADEGNREARELIGRAADYDAFAVAFLLQMYHPDALIFYGGQCRKEGFLYNELLRRLDFHVPPARRRGMSISISDLGERHVALGAARLYFEKLF